MGRGDRIDFPLGTFNVPGIASLAVLGVLLGASIEAHRLDEYLQAARVDLDLTRVEVRLALTPGVDVADAIVREIDVDRDGVLSQREQTAYVSCVLGDVHVDVDGRGVQLHSTSAQFPAATDLRGGEGTITIRADAGIPPLRPGAHRVSVRNAYHAEIGAYLSNALVPQTRQIAVKAQQRNADQSELAIDYVVGAAQ